MSTNTLPDYAGQNQSFDSSDAVLQHIDSLLSLVSHASFQSQPDRSTTYQQRREGYLRILKMRQALSNIETDLKADGLFEGLEKGV
jgi:hypothetical protein